MKKQILTARNADKHVLYQKSVQSPEVDVEFFSRYYRRLTGKPLRRFREDFCGTAILSSEFVKLHRENRAMGVDMHAPTLAWARKQNISGLNESQRERVSLVRGKVQEVRDPKADLIAAVNFSYWVFKSRKSLLGYFRNARRSLTRGGLFLVDIYGGSEAVEESEDRIRYNGFTYVWDQARFDPLTYEILCKIHFEFKDGSRLRNAFVYDWRLWTLPEVQELFREAGFRDVHVLWECVDRKTSEGNGVYRRTKRGQDDPSYIVFVVGRA